MLKEIVAKEGTRNIYVGQIQCKFMIRSNREEEKENVNFSNAHGDPFNINTFRDEDGFVLILWNTDTTRKTLHT